MGVGKLEPKLPRLTLNDSKYTSLIGVRNGESGDQVPVGHPACLVILLIESPLQDMITLGQRCCKSKAQSVG